MGAPSLGLGASARVAFLWAIAGASLACGRDDGAPETPGTGGTAPSPAPVFEDGVAIGFVYDTSGSMSEPVADGSGGQSPKYQVANRAFLAIVEKLRAFVASAPPDAPTRVETVLVRFQNAQGSVAMPLGRFDAAAMRAWIEAFGSPSGATPLGDAVRVAGDAVLRSNLRSKHLLVLTDGKNTAGPDPAGVLRTLRNDADGRGVPFSAHFVAFDVDAAEFAGVAALGATLVSAADETQLRERMEFILEEKILLETAAPRTPKAPR